MIDILWTMFLTQVLLIGNIFSTLFLFVIVLGLIETYRRANNG